MSSQLFETLTENSELLKRVRNEKRKILLSFIYEKARNYKEIKEFIPMNPGSLYHHLAVLEPLIVKTDHGVYEITEEGKQVVEALGLASTILPTVTSVEKPQTEIQKESQIIQNIIEEPQKDTNTDILNLIWLSKSTYIIVGVVIIITITLAMQGVALSGSALYAVGSVTQTFVFDILGITIALLLTYTLENMLQKYPVYSRLRFLVLIRVISMIPGGIIGFGLLILYQYDIIPTADAYILIYLLTLFSGFLLSALGTNYLRSETWSNSILYSVAVNLADVLLGALILIISSM